MVAQFDGEIEKKIEIVITDDASPDLRIEPMVKEFMKKHDNIHYHRYPKNMRLSSNLMHVTTFANGEYLWLMADDDCMTDFALKYTIEIIEKTHFDLLICNGLFVPDMNVPIDKKPNTFKTMYGMKDLVNYLYDHRSTYQDLVVYFQFYSILVVKHSYFKESLAKYDRDFIYGNIFPQDIVIYSHIKDKKIIIPDNIFIRGRTLNESYKASMKFITDFKLAMDMIEEANGLQ
ncbi:MAG: glycosyltransferase family 2 protein [bacterium]